MVSSTNDARTAEHPHARNEFRHRPYTHHKEVAQNGPQA